MLDTLKAGSQYIVRVATGSFNKFGCVATQE